MPTYYPATPYPQPFFNKLTGELLAGGSVEAQLANTTTQTPMYTDKNGTSAGAVITLNSGGYPSVGGNEVVIWLEAGIDYKFILRTADNSEDWTLNDISLPLPTAASDLGALNGQSVQDALNQLRKGADEPFIIVTMGQSNAAGVNSGGPNPASSDVHVWDGTTGDWGSSDYTQNPLARSNPDGNGGNNNIALAFAHRIQEFTGRGVYVVFDAVGGTSIDEWTSAGVASTRYAAISTKVTAALATPELAGKSTVDAIHWQQGEEDAQTNTFADYYGKFQTLISQLRAETWTVDTTPILVGAPSQALHERYEPKKAMRQFCNKDDAYAIWMNSAGLETSDSTHYTADSLWEMGYYRMLNAWYNGPSLNEVDMPLFYGRGTGPARPDDRAVICAASTLISWDSKTDEFPPNSSYTATGSISWGFQCSADGNYTLAGGYQVLTDNVCNYTISWGRDITSTGDADYCACFGYQNQLSASYSFVSGRGHIVADEGGSAIGLFSRYTTVEADPVIHQVGIGTSTGNRQNGITVRSSGTTEIYVPSTANDPTQDEELVIRRVDNTTLQLSMRGTDSVVRSVNLTLS